MSGRQLRDITADALHALKMANDPPFIFMRSGELCHVVSDEAARPSVEPANDSWIRGTLARTADWMRRTPTGNRHAAFPPNEVVRDIASMGSVSFPALSSVTEVPTLRVDGTILDEPGYDPISTVYYAPAPSLKMMPIPKTPTREELKEARNFIYEAIGDFPYADQASRANVYGLLLTPVLRPAIYGCTPLAVVDAPQAGTGKSLLIDVLSIITTGRPSAMIPYPYRDDEMQKQIGASLIAGRQLIAFDNLEGELRSPALALALTAKEYESRILGFSKNMRVPNMATWIVTGNNIRPAGDMPRRCYQIRLDARRAKPYTGRSFKHKDILRWVTENRSELLRALLIMARYWFSAGCPEPDNFSAVGSFEDWHRKIGGIVTSSGMPGFLSNYTDFIEKEDESTSQWEEFLSHIFDLYGVLSKPDVTREFSMAELVKELQSPESITKEKAPAEIADCVDKKGANHRIAIGKMFSSKRSRRFGYGSDQFWLERNDSGTAHKGSVAWVVRRSQS